MSHQLSHLDFPIREGLKSSYMYGLANIGAGLDLVNIEYYQSVAEQHPKLVLKFTYLKGMDCVDPFNISGIDGGKESEQRKGGVDVNGVPQESRIIVSSLRG